MIYTIKRNGVLIFQHEIRGSRTQSAPAVDFVDVEFDYSEAILFKNNDTIEFDGQTYYCDKQYNSVLKKSTNLYNHRARFLSSNYQATNIALLDPQGLHIFEIEGNLLTLLTLAVNRLNAIDSGWSYDTPPTTVTKTFQIDGQNVMEFLARVSSEFEIPFYIQDKVIYYKDPALVDGGRFEYGKGNGFIDIRKSYKSGEKIPNTVYASGGDDLVLDDPVINNGDIANNGVIEGFYSNENIKPTTRVYMEGVVTADNVVTTTQINYDIQAQKIAGQTPLINFETGALGGLSFYITNSTWDTNTNVTVIYLKKRTVDGVLLPNNTVRALAGDYFNITNIRQPQAIIDEALFKLGQYATADMNNRILNNMSIEVTLDPLFPEDLKLNDSISVGDDNLELAGRFFILEIKTDLQNLNKKDIVLGRNFRYLNIPGLNVKNDNIIDLGIQNNYDDLVVIEEEVVIIKDEIERVKIDLDAVKVDTDELKLSVETIQVVELPLKENTSNKVNILEIEAPTSLQYPNAISVKEGLNLKQNKLIPSSNVSIANDVISVKVNNVTQTVPANTVTNNPNSTYAVQNDTNGNLVVNVPSTNILPVYHHFSSQSTVVVNHNKGAYASVGVMLGTEMVLSNIDQDVSMNSVTVNFSKPETGIIILNF